MKSRIKTVSLALATALLAVGVSVASAAEFHVSSTPATVSGVQTTGNVFTTDAGTVTCKTAAYSGTMSVLTSSRLGMAPSYNECTAFGFINVPIHENGCTYEFWANGTSEVICPAGKAMEITAPFCTVTIGTQHIVGSNTMHPNLSKTDIIVTFNWVGVDYNECGTSKTNGSFTGGATVTKSGTGSIWFG